MWRWPGSNVFVAVFAALGSFTAAPAVADGAITPLETQMVDVAAVQALYPDKQLDVAAARFSPDGRLLAIAFAGIVSGDPDQAWIYDLATGKIAPASPKRQTQPGASDTLSLYGRPVWGDARTLYVRGARSGGPSVTYVSSMDGMAERADLPTDIDRALTAMQSGPRTVNGEMRDGEVAIGALRIWSVFVGHGISKLRVQDGRKQPMTIATNSYLGNFAADTARRRLFYSSEKGVVAFDLKTRAGQPVAWTTARDAVLDIAPDGHRLAVARNVACELKAQPVTPDTSLKPRICLLRLP